MVDPPVVLGAEPGTGVVGSVVTAGSEPGGGDEGSTGGGVTLLVSGTGAGGGVVSAGAVTGGGVFGASAARSASSEHAASTPMDTAARVNAKGVRRTFIATSLSKRGGVETPLRDRVTELTHRLQSILSMRKIGSATLCKSNFPPYRPSERI